MILEEDNPKVVVTTSGINDISILSLKRVFRAYLKLCININL